MGITSTIKDMLGLEGNIKNLQHLFLHGLKDIYYGEKQLVDELASMAEQSRSTTLRDLFLSHRDQTVMHVHRLEECFFHLKEEPQEVTCEAIDGLAAEARELVAEAEPEMVDAALVFAAQAVEHYEIARYSALITWARKLGYPEVVRQLELNLADETGAESQLSALQGNETSTGRLRQKTTGNRRKATRQATAKAATAKTTGTTAKTSKAKQPGRAKTNGYHPAATANRRRPTSRQINA